MRIAHDDLLILCEKLGIRGCLHKNLYLLAPYDANFMQKAPDKNIRGKLFRILKSSSHETF